MLFCIQYYLLDRKYLIPDATDSPTTKNTSITQPNLNTLVLIVKYFDLKLEYFTKYIILKRTDKNYLSQKKLRDIINEIVMIFSDFSR